MLEFLECSQRVTCHILGKRLVLLHALEVFDELLSFLFLLVDDFFKLLVLGVYFHSHFIFQSLLSSDGVLKSLLLGQRGGALL